MFALFAKVSLKNSKQKQNEIIISSAFKHGSNEFLFQQA